jgi:hypothetical protein
METSHLTNQRAGAPTVEDVSKNVNDWLRRLGSGRLPYNAGMDTFTRNEVDAQLQAIEARLDARVARIEGNLDKFLAKMNERDRVLEERDKRLTLIAENAESSARRAEGMYKSLWGGIFAIFIAVLTIGVGSFYSIQQSNQGLVQAVISAFQLGQNTSQPEPSR